MREPEYTKKLRILMFISSFLVAYVLLCLLVKIRKFGEVFLWQNGVNLIIGIDTPNYEML